MKRPRGCVAAQRARRRRMAPLGAARRLRPRADAGAATHGGWVGADAERGHLLRDAPGRRRGARADARRGGRRC